MIFRIEGHRLDRVRRLDGFQVTSVVRENLYAVEGVADVDTALVIRFRG